MNKITRRLGLAAATVIVASAFGCANHSMSASSSASDSTLNTANSNSYGTTSNPMSTGARSDGGIISNTAPSSNNSAMASGTSSAMSTGSMTVASTTPTSVDADRSQTAAPMAAPAPMPKRAARADRN